MAMIKTRNPVRMLASAVALAVVLTGGALASAGLPENLTTVPNGFSVQLKNSKPETLDAVKELGAKAFRRGIYWDQTEKEKGVYDFAAVDALYKDAHDHGLLWVGCMFGNNTKVYGAEDGLVKNAAGAQHYAAFAAALAEHFKGKDGIMFEIWNEPNTMTFWGKHGKVGNSEPYAEEYTNLVKATAPAMKKADPNCIVLGGSVSNMWTASYAWQKFAFAKGILNTGIDAWSVHPYGLKSPEDYVEAYGVVRKMMVESGSKPLPLLDTERGFPLGSKSEGFAGGADNDPKKAEMGQGWHLVRQYMVDLLLDCRMTSWYEWSGAKKEGFSLVQDGEKTQAYHAAKFVIDTLNGYKLSKRIDLKSDRDFVLQFANKTGGVILVAWTSPPANQTPDMTVPHEVEIPVEGSGALTTYQAYGEKGSVNAAGGKITLKLTAGPQYVVVKAGK